MMFRKNKSKSISGRRHSSEPSKPPIRPSSSPQYIYSSNRSQPDRGKGRHHNNSTLYRKRLNKLILAPTYLAIAGIIIAIGYSISLFGAPVDMRVNSPDIITEQQMTADMDIDQLRDFAHQYINKRPFESTKLTLNTQVFEKEIITRFPEIAKIEVHYGLIGRGIIIDVVPEIIHVVLVLDNKYYGLNENGKSVQLIEEPSNNSILISEAAGVEALLGEKLLPAQTVEYIYQLHRQIKYGDLVIDNIMLPAIANELHMTVAGDKYYGKFDIAGDVRLQSGGFIATRRKLEQTDIEPTEYIDVRIAERVYYR